MKDLTKGNITKLIISFSLPLLFGNVFQLLYNLADTRIVGQALGAKAIGALGATSSLNWVIIGFLSGLANGFALVSARYFGAKNMKMVRKAVAKALVLGVATAVIFTVLSLVCLDPLLKWLNTPADIYKQAKDYIFIILAGLTVTTIYNVLAGIFQAVGDTVSPLIFLIISTIINIILDLLFIYTFHGGVKGAALATLAAQVVSVILCAVELFRKHRELIPHFSDFKIDLRLSWNMYSSGAAMGAMLALVGVGTVVMQGAINGFGTDTVIAHTTARKVSEIYFLPISVFGAACATVSGQNYGAGKLDRVFEGIWRALLLTWVWSAFVMILTWLCTPQIARLITGITDREIISTVERYMKINTSLYFVLAIVIVFRNALQGIDDKITPILSSLLELEGKVMVAKRLAPKLGYLGIILSEPLVWLGMAFILILGLYLRKIKTFKT